MNQKNPNHQDHGGVPTDSSQGNDSAVGEHYDMGRIQEALEVAENERNRRRQDVDGGARTDDFAVVVSHLSGSRNGTTESFRRETVMIGRGPFNDVCLDPFSEPTVSSQHAEIRIEGSIVALYDMGSLNGTYLNGVFVRRAELESGDEIQLGRCGPLLRYECHQAPPAAGGPWESPSDRKTTPIPMMGQTLTEEVPIIDLQEDSGETQPLRRPGSDRSLRWVAGVLGVGLLIQALRLVSLL